VTRKKIEIAKPIIGRGEIRAVTKVLKGGNLAQGFVVSRFEEEFSRFVLGRTCIAVNSGTSALVTGLMALGIGHNDEVIVPSFTFAATANSVALVGAKPVFVDIDINTLNIDPNKIKSAITSRTRAIQVVHLYGLPANMDEICRIAREFKLYLIEDAAQAHLASIRNRPVGTFGDVAAFSFYPTKNMTSGEGGMVVVQDENLARNCRLIRNQGMETKYQNEIFGFNFRMTDIHAAIGLEQIKKIEKWTIQRQDNAHLLSSLLHSISRQEVPSGYSHVYHQYTIRLPNNRDQISEFLTARGIGNSIYYPTPVHKLKAFASRKKLPFTEQASKSVLSVPIHPGLKKQEVKRIADEINRALEVEL
jgi:dTDP-4-amino-4,6-dideoxygalactose transaminase